jgi:hypothetical protein
MMPISTSGTITRQRRNQGRRRRWRRVDCLAFGALSGVNSVRPAVVASGESAWPHVGQNRSSGWISASQRGQVLAMDGRLLENRGQDG